YVHLVHSCCCAHHLIKFLHNHVPQSRVSAIHVKYWQQNHGVPVPTELIVSHLPLIAPACDNISPLKFAKLQDYEKVGLMVFVNTTISARRGLSANSNTLRQKPM